MRMRRMETSKPVTRWKSEQNNNKWIESVWESESEWFRASVRDEKCMCNENGFTNAYRTHREKCCLEIVWWQSLRAHFIIISASARAPCQCHCTQNVYRVVRYKRKSALCSGAIFFWHSLVLGACDDADGDWQQSMLEATNIYVYPAPCVPTTTRRLHLTARWSWSSPYNTLFTMIFAMKPWYLLRTFIKLLRTEPKRCARCTYIQLWMGMKRARVGECVQNDFTSSFRKFIHNYFDDSHSYIVVTWCVHRASSTLVVHGFCSTK